LLITANVVLSSPILVTLMMEAISFSEASVLTRDKTHDIPNKAFLMVAAVKASKSYNIYMQAYFQARAWKFVGKPIKPFIN
jgi:hypothetical protein